MSKVTDWKSLTYVVVDVEGNGQQPPELVELAIVPIIGGVIDDPVCWMVRPGEPIKYMETAIHGIRNDDVADLPPFAEYRDDVLSMLDADAIVAHNAHVDVSVLRRQLPDWHCPEVFDTLKLARRLMPGHSSYKLGALVDALGFGAGLPDGLGPHRATHDALVTAGLFAALVARAGSLDELRQVAGGGDDEVPTLF
ncbi:exonuclease domain-containing protein [Catenulispora sp. EB89]|uniref:3'-5' exonuclease n=1 Tax=Catenulispora sp. EB89 TaxID=3156257 RepID=UPI003513E845